jgi:hypothetical protein
VSGHQTNRDIGSGARSRYLVDQRANAEWRKQEKHRRRHNENCVLLQRHGVEQETHLTTAQPAIPANSDVAKKAIGTAGLRNAPSINAYVGLKDISVSRDTSASRAVPSCRLTGGGSAAREEPKAMSESDAPAC